MIGIIEKYNKPFEYTGILMNLVLAIQFLTLWYAPKPTDAPKIFAMAVLMGFEFIMVHSGVFMALIPKKITRFILIPIYGLFAFAFYKATNLNTILIMYALVVLNRMRFAFSNASKVQKQKTVLTSIFAALSYFILIFVCVFSDGIFGPLALTETFLKTIAYKSYTTGGGIFIDTPHVAIAFGFFYYSTLTVIEALLLNFKPNP